MRVEPRNVALGMLLVLLVVVFYPALMLGRRVAPEVALKSVPPWSQEWGPNPEPRVRVLAAATDLGPRLAIIARDGLAAALWDPWIGGGRPGWLSAPREGGAPLPVIAAMLARAPWVWSALLGLTVAVAFAGAWHAARWLGTSAWGAAAAAIAYSLAGPVAAHWLDWHGSAVALGPVAVLPALAAGSSWRRHTAAWALAVAVLLLCGPPAVPFIALAMALEVIGDKPRRRAHRLLTLACALVLATGMRLPVAWLESAGGELGATATAQAPPALSGLRALVVPDTTDLRDLGSGAAAGVRPDGLPEVGFLGAATLLLAVLGFLALRGRNRWLWSAVASLSLALALAPAGWLAPLGATQRPLAVLALAAALLAGAGVDWVCRRLPERLVHLAGAGLCAVLLVELAPAALHGLPFASDRELQLQTPVAIALPHDGSRIVTMASALPPDVPASFGLADIRARRFAREPLYEALIRAGTSGAVQTLDPAVAALGARWVLEPSPLRLVSGIAFGDVDVFEIERMSAAPSTARYLIALPVDAGRIGLPRSEVAGAAVFVQGDGRTAALEEDRDLAEESAEWRWFATPPRVPHGEVVLGIIGKSGASPSLSLAVDGSGLRIVSEGSSLRVWEWARADRFAAFAVPQPDAAITVAAVEPARVELEVDAPAAGELVVQVKHRPALWRAEVDGARVATVAADRVWTGVPVPAGRSRVVLAAAVPWAVWLAAAAAAIIIALLAMPWRER